VKLNRAWFDKRPPLDALLRAQVIVAKTQSSPRERKERRRSCDSVGSRGDPSDESDEPPDDLTDLQAAFLAFLEGLVTASHGGIVTYVEFLTLVRLRIEAEAARLAKTDEDRP
jgi:hypothetical protein